MPSKLLHQNGMKLQSMEIQRIGVNTEFARDVLLSSEEKFGADPRETYGQA